MQESIRLVLSGGGTAGHIMPNIALIRAMVEFHKLDFTASASPNPSHRMSAEYGSGVFGSLPCKMPISETPIAFLYIGEIGSMEQELVLSNFTKDPHVGFKGIHCGKMRRYFSFKNFWDFFKIPVGTLQALKAIKSFKPRAVFCKGGYVSFPVAVAGWMAGIPVVLHESDIVPGLANRLCARFAKKICVANEETKKYFPAAKVVVTGNPVRPELANGNKEQGRKMTGLKENLPVILVMGGSQGANAINRIIWDNLVHLLDHYQIVHICGQEKVTGIFSKFERYKAYGFVGPELKDLYALADLIISRAGAMSLAEIDLIGKPALLIPLSKKASRGDQIDNAKVFAKTHLATVIEEENYDQKDFLNELKTLLTKSKNHKNSKPVQKISAMEKIINLLVNQ